MRQIQTQEPKVPIIEEQVCYQRSSCDRESLQHGGRNPHQVRILLQFIASSSIIRKPENPGRQSQPRPALIAGGPVSPVGATSTILDAAGPG